jgi:NADP-reducing hydrogenase subunit HndC
MKVNRARLKTVSFLRRDPHAIIEAMAIAAYAVGADEGYFYIRGEYALAQERVKNAIKQAKELAFRKKHLRHRFQP